MKIYCVVTYAMDGWHGLIELSRNWYKTEADAKAACAKAKGGMGYSTEVHVVDTDTMKKSIL